MTSRSLALLVILLLSAQACSSVSHQSPVLPAVLEGASAPATGTLVIRVRVPRSGFVPNYLGPATRGMTVAIAGPTQLKETVGLRATDNGCKSKLMTLECTLSIPNLKACPSKKSCYVATVATYDAYANRKIPPGAHALSEDRKFRFTIGKTATTVPLVLYGIPGSIAFFPSSTSSLSGSQTSGFVEPKCTASAQNVNLVARDADRNFIVGVGSPALSLTSDDSSQLAVSGGSNGNFVLSPPSLPAYPHGGHTLHLTARAAASKYAGHKNASSVVSVTYSGMICGIISEFVLPSGIGSGPFGIASGPDGALWFTEALANKIGRVTTDGAITEFGGLTASAGLIGIAPGPDGALWFVENSASKIGRITTTGSLTEFPTLTGSSGPTVIVAGPDGRLWFTESGANDIGASTTAGSMTEFPVPTASSTLQGIAVGPDGALWFTELTGNKIGRISTSGTITETSIPTASSGAIGITTGSDGQLWFMQCTTNKVGRLRPNAIGTGTFTGGFVLPESSSGPLIDALGPDGNIWITEEHGNRVASINNDGQFTEYGVPTGAASPGFVTTGPDGSIWFTEVGGGKIGRIR